MSLPRRALGALALSTCLVAVAASSAQANNRFTLDPKAVTAGHVLLNPAGSVPGTALVAWATAPADGNNAPVPRVCLVPAGGPCTAPVTLTIPGAGADGQIDAGQGVTAVLPVAGPGTIVWVFGPRDAQGDVLRWTSKDGGVTFGGAASIADANPGGLVAPDDAVSIGANTLIGMTGSATVGLGAFPSGLATAGKNLTFAAPGDDVASSTTALDLAGRPVIAYYTLGADAFGADSKVRAFRFTSAQHEPVDLAKASNWSGPADIATGYEPVLAGGQSGLFLVSQDTAPGTDRPTVVNVRKDDGTGFGAPIATLSADGANDLFEGGAAAQSPGGRLAVLWPGVRAGDDLKVLRLFTSTDRGASFSESDVAAIGDGYAGDRNAQTALGDDGQGVVTFRDGGGLQVADLSPIAPFAPQQTPPQQTPPQQIPQRPIPIIPPVFHPVYNPTSGPYLSTSTHVGTDIVTFKSPKGCVRSGVIRVRLSIRPQRFNGHVVIKVGSVLFRLDHARPHHRGSLLVTSRPFSASFRIRVLPGSHHTLTAVASLRNHQHRKITRTLTSHFTGCPA